MECASNRGPRGFQCFRAAQRLSAASTLSVRGVTEAVGAIVEDAPGARALTERGHRR